jgi:hypothetical protein
MKEALGDNNYDSKGYGNKFVTTNFHLMNIMHMVSGIIAANGNNFFWKMESQKCQR